MTKPDQHGEGEYAFNSSPVEMSHGYLADLELLELPQEVESLVRFTDQDTSVEIP